MFDLTTVDSSMWTVRTADEIRAVAREDGSLLVLPIGSIEQHGQHLPVATDSILAEEITELGAKRVREDVPIVIGPTFWAGHSPHHIPFGGTLSLEFETMLEAIEEIADTALSNGFDAILLVNGHGGNKPLISAATSTIGKDNPDVEVLSVTYFDLATEFIDEIRDSDVGGMSHGGEFETSLMLHLHPDLVREDKMEAPELAEPYEEGIDDLFATGTVSVYREFDSYSSTGAIGSPELASDTKGEEIYNRLGEQLSQLFWSIHEKNT